LAGGWLLVRICSGRTVPLASWWWPVCYERKYCWLVVDKPVNCITMCHVCTSLQFFS
jgi:hypothetical protein